MQIYLHNNITKRWNKIVMLIKSNDEFIKNISANK